MKNKIDVTYLGDILDAIKRIEGYLRGVDRDSFEENLMMQDAVMHQIEIIGEFYLLIGAEMFVRPQKKLHFILNQ